MTTTWEHCTKSACHRHQACLCTPCFIPNEEQTKGRSIGKRRIETWHSVQDKSQYKVVRTDTYAELPGSIIMADEETGECCMHIGSGAQTFELGPNGIRIMKA